MSIDTFVYRSNNRKKMKLYANRLVEGPEVGSKMDPCDFKCINLQFSKYQNFLLWRISWGVQVNFGTEAIKQIDNFSKGIPSKATPLLTFRVVKNEQLTPDTSGAEKFVGSPWLGPAQQHIS